jgi:ankyrin repeat protein
MVESLKAFSAACTTSQDYLTHLNALSSSQILRAKLLNKSLKKLADLPDSLTAFNPKSQRKTKHSLKTLLPQHYCTDRLVRMACCTYWWSLRNEGSFSFIGALDNYVRDNSQDLCKASYPLHQAVFERDLVCISHLCSGEDSRWLYVDLEQCDPHGLTPLMLAMKLNYPEEATVLLDFGADPKYSASSELTPYEYAIATKNLPILTRMLASINSYNLEIWEMQREVCGS